MTHTREILGRNSRTSTAHGRSSHGATTPPPPPPAPTLAALHLSAATFAADALVGAAIGTVSGQTAGSTVSVFPAEGRVSLVGTGLRVGSTAAAAGTFSVTLRETLTGATNTPRDTTFTITVTAAATPPPVVTLGTLTLSAATFAADNPAGTFIGAIVGKTASSTLAVTPSNTHVSLSGTSLSVGATASSAGTFDVTIRETLTGATNTPKDTTFTLTVAAAAPTYTPSGYGNDGSGTIPGGATVVTPVTLAAAISGASTSANLTLALEPGSYGAVSISKVMDSGKTLTLYGQTGVSMASLNLNGANGVTVKYANVTSLSGSTGDAVRFAVQTTGASRITLDHLSGNPGGLYTGVGVSMRSADTVSVTNCDFSFYGTAISPFSSRNIIITDNRISDIDDNFIFANLTEDTDVLRNLLLRPGGPNSGQHRDAIQWASTGSPDSGGPTVSARVNIKNNTFIRDSGLATVQGIAFTESTDDLAIEDNASHGCTTNGISVSGGNRISVKGNFIQGRTDTDAAGSPGGSSRVLIRGNADTVNVQDNQAPEVSYLNNAEEPTNITPVGIPNPTGAPSNLMTGFNGNVVIANATGIGDTSLLLTFLAANTDNPRP